MPPSTAVSSTTPPREKLSTTAPGFIWAMPPASIIPRVASMSGTCRVRKLLCLSTSPRLCAFLTVAGRLHAESTVMSGSYPITCMPSLIAASATRQPILPRPITPSVCPASS